MPLVIDNLRGELWCAGRKAATLSHVHLRVDGHDRLTAGGVVTIADNYWYSREGPFVLRVRVGKRLWVWRDVSIERLGGQVRMNAQGRPEIR